MVEVEDKVNESALLNYLLEAVNFVQVSQGKELLRI